MAYEIEALDTGWRLGLHTSDWENLLGLAHRYGWRPLAGLDHYRNQEHSRIVSSSDARAFAEALSSVLKHLPPERRKEVRPMGVLGGEAETPHPEQDMDYESYFAWNRRWIIEEVVRLCERGTVQIRQF